MTDWQPIETAPKDGTVVLLWADTYYPVVGWFRRGLPGAWCDVWEHDWNRPSQPTHWMPLPPDPTA